LGRCNNVIRIGREQQAVSGEVFGRLRDRIDISLVIAVPLP